MRENATLQRRVYKDSAPSMWPDTRHPSDWPAEFMLIFKVSRCRDFHYDTFGENERNNLERQLYELEGRTRSPQAERRAF